MRSEDIQSIFKYINNLELFSELFSNKIIEIKFFFTLNYKYLLKYLRHFYRGHFI